MKKFPQIKKANRGKFTTWAKANGFKDACSAATAVMKAKKKVSIVKTLGKWLTMQITLVAKNN